MSYEGFVTIVLTALAVMLAGIGLMIGIMAIWGYAEMRNFLRAAAERHVAKVMEDKLGQYPTPDELVEMYKNQLVTNTTNPVASASNTAVQEIVAPRYPDGEPADARSRETGVPDAGTNNP